MDLLKPLQIHPELPISNIDLFNGDTLSSLQKYFEICSQASDLLVTTSCFAEWKKGKSTNGTAKVIPAVPADSKVRGQAVRVFFFDDNINLSLSASSGAQETKGICNLRDITTAKYVDFSAGCNGFTCDSAYRHTLIHHSSKYNNVLVQANILDAMSNVDYFSSIVSKYCQKGEKVLVFMDVNGTILWSDSIMGHGPNEILLGTMFMFAEVRPRKPFEVTWGNQPTIKVEKRQMVKQLLNDLAKGDNDILHEFWQRNVCERFMNMLMRDADLGWSGHEATFSSQEFFSVHSGYMESLRKQDSKGAASHGIATSWFRCLSMLQRGRHAIVINSFGMDTYKVVLRSARNARRVLHMAVNFETWSERDTTKFQQQFEAEALPQPPPRFAGCGMGGIVDIISCRQLQCAGNEADRPCAVSSGGGGFEVPDYVFIYVVRKPSQDVTLGAKVTHLDVGLEVAEIFPKGAIESSNEVNKSLTPPAEVIRIGDIIREVNEISGDTKAMVEECKRCMNVSLVVARPLRLSNQMGFCGGAQYTDPYDEELIVTTVSTCRRTTHLPSFKFEMPPSPHHPTDTGGQL
mmetsp:Transcript_49776/g.160934  ORF Transcript_49776/g.160934 Transcript_49776/m.160934 type:complete len:575 (-) Transcript_49776:252-1976(-)